ncbi:hypothetical protein LCGC14_1514910 [marine sediment metagenome]|uniref:DUF3185 family protein n=1 Tax=marine sediment metagenome TaxID=412755 RepID=A0A0F9JL21_9ZZZZ|nr:DUF3185 family protein [Nitrospirota bacterium]
MDKGKSGISKLFSIGLLVVGVILLVLGFQEYGAFGSKLGRALGQTPSREVLLYFVAGGGCALAGFFGLLKK